VNNLKTSQRRHQRRGENKVFAQLKEGIALLKDISVPSQHQAYSFRNELSHKPQPTSRSSEEAEKFNF
jgi:hypothetical protein